MDHSHFARNRAFSESRRHPEYAHDELGPTTLQKEFEIVARHNAPLLAHIRSEPALP